MKNDLISREVSIESFRAMNNTGTDCLPVNVVIEIIEETPAVDAEPVRHGRWVAVPSSDMATGKAYKCSECNKMRYGSFMPNYCQNCGAKMDGGDCNENVYTNS